MNAVHRNLHLFASFTLSMLLFLTGCSALIGTPSVDQEFLAESVQTSVPCEACVQATLAAALTQQKTGVDNQAASTAEIVRVNAQATLDAANATLGAAQTQDQNNANVVAAQIAATAEIERANAQATLNSAGSTQNAALTLDAIWQTQMADQATSGAQSLLIQQNKDELAASTQTAIANNIATQTQAAAATSQWYVDQDRQRAEQRQGPIAFLWALCLPTFIVIFAGLVLWGFWRWLRIQQANQRILENPVDKLPAPAEEVRRHRHDDLVPYLESDIDNGYQVTTPDDQVQKWVDEVKSKLNDSDKKNENDNTDK
jgi:hypothetical protein